MKLSKDVPTGTLIDCLKDLHTVREKAWKGYRVFDHGNTGQPVVETELCDAMMIILAELQKRGCK